MNQQQAMMTDGGAVILYKHTLKPFLWSILSRRVAVIQTLPLHIIGPIFTTYQLFFKKKLRASPIAFPNQDSLANKLSSLVR